MDTYLPIWLSWQQIFEGEEVQRKLGRENPCLNIHNKISRGHIDT